MVIHSMPEETPSQDHERVGLLLESKFNVEVYQCNTACRSSGKKPRLLLVTYDKEQLKHSIMKRSGQGWQKRSSCSGFGWTSFIKVKNKSPFLQKASNKEKC